MNSDAPRVGRPPDAPHVRVGRGAGGLVAAGWLVVAVVAGAIAWLAVPAAARGGAFWLRLGWFQVLWALVATTWYLAFASSGRPADLRARVGAVTPTLFLVAGGYAAVSLSAMGLHALLPDGPAVDRAHLMAQLAIFAAAAVAAVLLGVARVGAIDGASAGGGALPPAPPPQALHDRVLALETRLPAALRGTLGDDLRRLRERLLHSLSPTAALLERADYRQLSDLVMAFCADVGDHVRAAPDDGVPDAAAGAAAGDGVPDAETGAGTDGDDAAPDDRLSGWRATASALAARARDVAEGSVVR